MLEDNTETYSLQYPDEKSYSEIEKNTTSFSPKYDDNEPLYCQNNTPNCKNIELFYNETIKNVKLYKSIYDQHVNILYYFIKKLDLVSNIKYYNVLELTKYENVGKFFDKIKIGKFLNKKTYPGEYCYLNQKRVIYDFKIFNIIINFTIFPVTNIDEINIYKNYNQIDNIKYKIINNTIDVILFYQLYNEDNYHLLTSYENFKTSIYDIINENFTKNDYLDKIVPIYFDFVDINKIMYYYNNDQNYRVHFNRYIQENMKKVIYNPMFINLFTILDPASYIDKDGNTFLHYAMFYNIIHVMYFLC